MSERPPAGRPDRRRLRLAIHEAGHVVVGRALGRKLDRVSLAREGDRHGHTAWVAVDLPAHLDDLGYPRDLMILGATSAAGSVAEHLAMPGEERYWQAIGQNYGDIESMLFLAAVAGVGSQQEARVLYEAWRHEAESLIRADHHTHRTIAQALTYHVDSLTADQLERLLEDNPPETGP